jgi:hypothetical protein
MKYLTVTQQPAQPSDSLSPIIRLFSDIYASHQSSQVVRLDQLLYLSNRREASDPLDVVYGLYGLVRHPSMEVLKPDYSLSTAELYQKTMVYIIEDRQDLNFLIHAARQRPNRLVDNRLSDRRTTQASWCFDFSSRTARLDPTELTHSHRRYSTLNIGGASSGHPFSGITYHPVIHGLEVSGTLVGRITSLATRPDWKSYAHTDVQDFLTLRAYLESLTVFAQDAWIRRLDLATAQTKTAASDVWKLLANGRVVDAVASNIPDYATLEHLRVRVNNLGDEAEGSQLLVHAYGKLMALNVRNLSAFETDSGYVGSSYAGVEVGDVVCVLFGCQLPVVLRPDAEGRYGLVDAVYVDGIMGGEFLEGEREEGEFVLV